MKTVLVVKQFKGELFKMFSVSTKLITVVKVYEEYIISNTARGKMP